MLLLDTLTLTIDSVYTHSVTKLVTTPVPFPLIQLTVTFTQFYLLTVPFALLSADEKDLLSAIAHCAVIFVLSYGIIGLAFISRDLDDPFGEDASDFK